QLSREELATLEKEIRQAGGDQLTELDKRINELQPAITPKTKDPRFGYHSTISADPNEEKWVEVDLGMPQSIDRIALRPCHDDYAGIGAGFGFPVRFKVTVQLEDKGPWQTAVDQTKQDVPNPGLMPVEFSLKEVTARTIRITATQLAERKNDYIFAIAELQVFDAAGENIAIGKPVSAMDSIEAPVRWAKTNLTDGLFAQMADESRAREYAEATQERQSLLNKIETPERVRRRRTLKDDIAQAEKQLADLPSGKMVYAAATHFDARGNFHPTLGEPRAVHVLDRGNLQNPREVATPCTLPIIPEVDAILELPPNHLEGDRRRALAEWITRPDNPLTWRSVVNRIWQYHFGQGIVPSPNDFGRMGRLPSHSELLDWLAVEFRDNGQSWKHLHRLIVTSSTYRQQSTNQPENAEIDGSNRFLWRMNRRRLEAEEIRDAILTMSGRMNPEMGGPGYYLFELEKPEHSPHYEYHKFDADDAKSHRRSIYRFIVRSQPDPYMTTLDCADSSQSTPKREETVTALQALSLLNNDFNLTMSRHFARRLKQHSSTLDKQVTHGFQLTTGRPPTVEELTQLTRYAEQHGTENLCRILLNLNEFIYLD
ncbi:MAG: DUF1553 domain-containing protein, partial [Planctomycetaceae bacterium]|nr:DUF1553 domain-containing protein [Planctomycetaceae bacterium]